jgi:HK97 family phage prohead protease
MSKYDFSGWATKNDLQCSDGRTIRRDAFKDNDGQTVPLVWNHQHNDSQNVLGHALLENRPEGVYAYCKFNDTPAGKNAKMLVEHGDVSALSIYANRLKQNQGNVTHGVIREVSLVLAGANPGAFIDSIMRHGECSDEEAVIYTGEDLILEHADKEDEMENDNKKEKTVQDVVNSMSEEQRNVMYALIGQALEDVKHNDEEKEDVKHSDDAENQNDNNGEGEDNEMKHNVFENDNNKQNNTLSHADMEMILKNAKRCGSLKEAVLAHADEHGDAIYDTYGIKPNADGEGISMLFPEYKNLNNTPEFIKRDTGWVAQVMAGVHHTPFSRIKSMFADIREDEARALGYMKGDLKKEEVFSLLKRTTDPQTIYKKQKLHRDDVIDITSFDVVAWIKAEMRMMLDEEIARAILIGDGRLADDDNKIQQQHIRAIINEDPLFAIHKDLVVANGEDEAKGFIKTVLRARKEYKGSGEPTMFLSDDMLTEMLLLEDKNGRLIYESEVALARALRVKNIVTVPVMEGVKNDKGKEVLAVVVNLKDYNVGADKGGAVAMFEDFDIDYNAQKYLIETRCSGALVKPFSAIVIEKSAE